MIQDNEIDAWLGDALADVPDPRRAEFARLVREYDALTANRPGERADYRDDDAQAWIAALELVEGKFDLPARRQAFSDARAAMYAGAVMAVLSGRVPEYEAAAQAGISRMTLRKLLGK